MWGIAGQGAGLLLYRSQQAFLCFVTVCGVLEGMMTNSQIPISLYCYCLMPGVVLLRQGLIN